MFFGVSGFKLCFCLFKRNVVVCRVIDLFSLFVSLSSVFVFCLFGRDGTFVFCFVFYDFLCCVCPGLTDIGLKPCHVVLVLLTCFVCLFRNLTLLIH